MNFFTTPTNDTNKLINLSYSTMADSENVNRRL